MSKDSYLFEYFKLILPFATPRLLILAKNTFAVLL